MLQPQDDLIHPIGSEPWWREAWYWGFYDQATHLHFLCYQGVFPNQQRADVTVGLYHGPRVVNQLMEMNYHVAPDVGDDRLAFGPVILKILRPMEQWSVYYSAPGVEVDVTFQAVQPAFSWAESKLWMEKSQPAGGQAAASSRHYDQVGRFTGEVRYDGKAYRIDTLGFRDHMWGWGGRSKWKQYIMLWPIFGEDLIVNVYPMGFTEGKDQLVGYIHSAGRRDLLQACTFHVDWRDAGRVARRLFCDIESQSGKKLHLEAEPINLLDTSGAWPHRTDHLLFGMAKYQCEGRTTFGELAYCYAREAERPTDWTVRND